MDWSTTTKTVLILVTVLLVAYDLLAYSRGGSEATVSRVVLSWAERFPLFPLAVGVLLGHLFSSQVR